MTEIRWEDPPPRATKTLRSKWRRLLAPLTEQPKRWAIVDVKETRDRARQTASNLQNHGAKLPPGQWEFTWETVDGEHRVYARYLGPDEDGAS